MDQGRFRFTQRVVSSEFSRMLTERVDEYFSRRGIAKRADMRMIVKTVVGFVSWIATYLWLLTGRCSPLEVIVVYVIHGFTQLHMGLNIAHDASHAAYSQSPRVNRTLSCVFDLVGLSSYMWRLMHNDAHHVFINVQGADSALECSHLFRFSPHDERRSFHRYQHLYAPLFYCLSTLDWVLAKDYRWLRSARRFGNRDVVKHPRHEVVFLFGAKAFYYTYMLVVPLLYLSVPWYSIILGFIVMHVFLGLTLAVTFQPNHFTAQSSFPAADGDGRLSTDRITHVFDTTVDYARANPLAHWLLGGLNLHASHHMFPGICHVHYPALTEIIKSTAEDCGLPYRENRTITGAFLAHLKWLKILGTAEGHLVPAHGERPQPHGRHA